MPIKKSAMKALRQSQKKAHANAKIKSDVAALVRKVNKTVAAKDAAKAAEWLGEAIKKLDRSAQKGIIKKNTAARKKSRLHKLVKSIAKK
ncbi:MAG: 30S ribosomal protein S20 [Patescibacteria group bacterium]|nr:30S ribosomal protein S20 [Patescibacteria group bacterium]